MVNLVTLPSPSKGTAPATSTPATLAPKAMEEKKPPISAPEVKESKMKEVKREEGMHLLPKTRPQPRLKEMPVAQMKVPSSSPMPRKAQSTSPPEVSPFSLPPLPSVIPGEETAHLQTEGASGGGGPATRSPAISTSPASREGALAGEEGGRSGDGVAIPGVASTLPGVSVDNPDFQFTYYLIIIQNKISSNWNPPYSAGKPGERRKTVVAFRILRNGNVRDVRVETSSGVSFLDQSAVRAISRSSPLPPMPQRFLDDSLGVHFSFELEGEKS